MKLLALLLIGFLNDTTPAENWNRGVIVTHENEVITGEFAVNLEYSSLILKNSQGVSVLPSHQVNSFRFYDEEFDINRKYVALEMLHENFTVRQFYEVVEDGQIQVVRTKKAIESPYSFDEDSYSANDKISLSGEAYNYNYFIRFDAKLVPLEKFKKMVLPHIISHISDISLYIDEHRLNLHEPSSAVKIIQYYNDLGVNSSDLSLAR